ncbi:MAG: hypothetical protein JXR58_02875 [Bacteroidales bacterium]|nr:hypothetical protein [Bacteroidales bacterium]
MADKKTIQNEVREYTVEEKLRALFQLQNADSEIDKIRILRGELPLEVQDLEDEIAGLETRLANYQDDLKELQQNIVDKKNEIKGSETLIKKYQEQQMNVRNNREYDSLSKEIEFQTLEMQLCEKRIKEYTNESNEKSILIEDASKKLEERRGDLEHKRNELDEIIAETQKEEDELSKNSEAIQEMIESRLLNAYKRIRKNARNGLAVVSVERDACGGCFNKIPPQRQLDIKTRKKIIVCEYCGRILVDSEIMNPDAEL